MAEKRTPVTCRKAFSVAISKAFKALPKDDTVALISLGQWTTDEGINTSTTSIHRIVADETNGNFFEKMPERTSKILFDLTSVTLADICLTKSELEDLGEAMGIAAKSSKIFTNSSEAKLEDLIKTYIEYPVLITLSCLELLWSGAVDHATQSN